MIHTATQHKPGMTADGAHGRPWRSIFWWAAVVSLMLLLLNAKFGTLAAAGFLGVWACILAAWPARGTEAVLHGAALPWAFPGLAAASVLWSAAPEISARAAGELCITTAAALLMARLVPARAFIAALMCATQAGCLSSLVFAGTRVMGNAGGQALVGVFASKNYLAYVVGLSLISALAVLADGGQPRPLRAVAGSALLGGPLLLWQAKSVGAIAALSVALGVLGVCTLHRRMARRWRMPALAGSLALGVVAAASLGTVAVQQKGDLLAMVGKDAGLTGRGYLWAHADTYIAERPAVGIGYQAFWLPDTIEASGLWRYAKVEPGAGFHFHNLFYETAVELGAAGVLVMGLTVVATLGRIVVWQLRAPAAESCFFMAMGGFLLMRGFVEVDLLYPFGIGSVLLPVAYVAAGRDARGRRPAMRRGEVPA